MGTEKRASKACARSTLSWLGRSGEGAIVAGSSVSLRQQNPWPMKSERLPTLSCPCYPSLELTLYQYTHTNTSIGKSSTLNDE